MAQHPARVIVMGGAGSGKSTFISSIVGVDIGISHGIPSQPDHIQEFKFVLHARLVTLVETPGIEDMSSADQGRIKEWLDERTHSTSVIYLHRVNECRETRTMKKELQKFRSLCEDRHLSKVAMVATHWSDSDGGPRAEQEFRYYEFAKNNSLKPFHEKGAKLRRLTPRPSNENPIDPTEAWNILYEVLNTQISAKKRIAIVKDQQYRPQKNDAILKERGLFARLKRFFASLA